MRLSSETCKKFKPTCLRENFFYVTWLVKGFNNESGTLPFQGIVNARAGELTAHIAQLKRRSMSRTAPQHSETILSLHRTHTLLNIFLMLKVLCHTERGKCGSFVSGRLLEWGYIQQETLAGLVNVPQLLFFALLFYVRSIIIWFYLSVLFTRRKCC